MWDPLLTGWVDTLAAAAGLVALGLAGWLCVNRWPRARILWTTGLLAIATYIGANWLGTLLSVHSDMSMVWPLARHTGVVLLAATLAVLLVRAGAPSSRS